MTESVEAPERIWIESEGGCPYFYHEDEISDVGSHVTEYVSADKLRAENEALRELEDRAQRDAALLRQALDALAYWLEHGETPGSHDIIQRTHDVLQERLK